MAHEGSATGEHHHTHDHDGLGPHSHPLPPHPNSHNNTHDATHNSIKTRRIQLETNILQKNDQIAAKNRHFFEAHGIQVFNLMSSPGSGKTLLLEKTLQKIAGEARPLNYGAPDPFYQMGFITGDQEGDFDAKRIQKAGGKVLQLNTKSSCHLNSEMIHHEIGHFIQDHLSVLFIENVGNLVCPAAFDLGESFRVALISTTEGEDKPSKYPLLFHEADLVVITKIDLMPHLDWDMDQCIRSIRRLNASAPILPLSSKTMQGFDGWIAALKKLIGNSKSQNHAHLSH